jgi:hypothetical protein
MAAHRLSLLVTAAQLLDSWFFAYFSNQFTKLSNVPAIILNTPFTLYISIAIKDATINSLLAYL